MKELVVAKYKENTEWLSKVGEDWEVTVYDKEEDLPNIGRESHTFVYHICLNYTNLADVTVFSQGKYIDHCGDFLNKLSAIKHGHGYTPLSDRIMQLGVEERTYYEIPDKVKNCQEMLGLPVCDISFPYGAFMAVDKETILKRPLSYYLMLLTLVSSSVKITHEMEYMWPGVFK